jgi:hypothetical protein
MIDKGQFVTSIMNAIDRGARKQGRVLPIGECLRHAMKVAEANPGLFAPDDVVIEFEDGR